eukprot:gene42784-25127_t
MGTVPGGHCWNGDGACEAHLTGTTSRTCAKDFCPACSAYPHYCDKYCGYCSTGPPPAYRYARFVPTRLRNPGTCRPWLIDQAAWDATDPSKPEWLNTTAKISAELRDDTYCCNGKCDFASVATTFNTTTLEYTDRYANSVCSQLG